MILVIDAGNSRIKWGGHEGGTWLKSGTVSHAEITTLYNAWEGLPSPQTVVIANVAGEKIRAVLESALARFKAPTHWVEALAVQCGVRNGYEVPAQLGVDRWAAAIAAWHICHESCVVINAGTAVTVDTLSRDGVFLGGLILPGTALMRDALAQNTALKFPRGRLRTFPGNTADAVESGILQAVLGAVEHMRTALGDDVPCLLSGGTAAELAPHLNPQPKVVDNLVLEGLILIAHELENK